MLEEEEEQAHHEAHQAGYDYPGNLIDYIARRRDPAVPKKDDDCVLEILTHML